MSVETVASGQALSQGAVLDPVTYEVIRHRLWSINDEACTTMVHASGSPVVHASDFNFAMYTPAGDMAVIGMLYMIPVGTMSILVKLILETYHDEIAEGDVFFCNDPYLAAAHQNDVQVVAPFFQNGKILGWTGGCAHQLDVGGMEPGSWCPKATDVHQEGIRIPPVRLMREGKRVHDVWNIILTASRLPFLIEMDLTAMLAANKVAHQRLAELHDRYGSDNVLQAMYTSLDQSESVVREALRSLPDGVYEHTDFLDHDGHTNEIYDVRCVLTKSGEKLTVDLSSSSPQAPGFVNSTKPATIGAIISGLFPLLGADAPSWNDGILRPVEIITAEGTIVHARYPAPVGASSVGAAWCASHAVVAAISKMIATDEHAGAEATATSDGSWPLLNLFGLNRFGEPFGDMFLDPLAWGGGAYQSRDGIDSGGALLGPTGHILDVETKESSTPVLYLWRRERRDTGGAGRYRGGVTIEFAVTPYGVDGLVATLATHGVSQPNCAGLFGGFPGSNSGYEFVRSSDLFDGFARSVIPATMDELPGRHEDLEAKPPMLQLIPGDVLNILPQGGGGIGDPLDRNAESVAEDVGNGRVSRGAAYAVYGVTLNDDLVVEVATTEQARRDALMARLEKAGPSASTSTKHGLAEQDEHESGHADEDTGINYGGVLRLRRHGAGFDVFCDACDCEVGNSEGQWLYNARALELESAELGGQVHVDDRMSITALLCPGCGRALSTTVHRRGKSTAESTRILA
ncbi:MAG TPA: hydantoinase B/oxoprolinase family protein [Tepidiformaceae bacterium]